MGGGRIFQVCITVISLMNSISTNFQV